jgi:hypothetical protein
VDALTLSVWADAKRGEVEAVRACVRIADRRAKLLGLDRQIDLRCEALRPTVTVNNHQALTLAALTDEQLFGELQRLSTSLSLPHLEPPAIDAPVAHGDGMRRRGPRAGAA